MSQKPILAFLAAASLFALSLQTHASGFIQSNLVTDSQSAHAAQTTDPNLVNPWGMSYSPTGTFWVGNNGTGTSTIYSVDKLTDATAANSLVVAIPGNGSVTGQAYNAGSGFNSDRFLFVSEDGTVSGWRGTLGTSAEILQTGLSSNVYKGSALNDLNGHSYLLAANFKSGSIDVLKGDSGAPSLSGNFLDPNLPSGYAPHNIQTLGGATYVSYAKQGSGIDPEDGAGHGFVDEFDLNGNFSRRIASSGSLNSPWAMAIAPTSFGNLAGDLLIGNSGDGTISAYDLNTATFVQQLTDPQGNPLVIDGLHGLLVGNDGNAGSSDRLYFTAGPDGETHGLFGSLTYNPVPEPCSMAALALGFAALARRRKK